MIKLAAVATGIWLSLAFQTPQEIKWICTSKKLDDRRYELHLKALLHRPWHIYSQHLIPGGPLPTKITFDANPDYQTIGQLSEVGSMIAYPDPAFHMEVSYYADSVDFVQVIRFKNQKRPMITGTVDYMICSDSRCKEPSRTLLKWAIK